MVLRKQDPTSALGVTIDAMLDDLPLHQSFYLRGVMNSFRTAFMPANKRTLTADDMSGESLEMLRTLVNNLRPDIPDGFVANITYDDINDFYKLDNVFKKEGFDLSGFEDQVKMALGGFQVRRDGDTLTVVDEYDFPPPGEWQMYPQLETATDYMRASQKDPDKVMYFSARFLGERIMQEGDPDNMSIRIELPKEPKVVNIDFDDDPPPNAQDFVFRGAMTNKRKTLWDRFTSLFITPAEARLVETNTPDMLGNLAGEFGSEGMLYGQSAYERSITESGIRKERELRKKIVLPK